MFWLSVVSVPDKNWFCFLISSSVHIRKMTQKSEVTEDVFLISCLWMAIEKPACFLNLLQSSDNKSTPSISAVFLFDSKKDDKEQIPGSENKTLFEVNQTSLLCDWTRFWFWDQRVGLSRVITMESTMKLQVMISTVSSMLLKGSHGATSRASCREWDTVRSEWEATVKR